MMGCVWTVNIYDVAFLLDVTCIFKLYSRMYGMLNRNGGESSCKLPVKLESRGG